MNKNLLVIAPWPLLLEFVRRLDPPCKAKVKAMTKNYTKLIKCWGAHCGLLTVKNCEQIQKLFLDR